MNPSSLGLAAAIAALLPLSAASAVTVVNGNFEANASAYTVSPGYNSGGPDINPSTPTGWTSVGGVGINPVSPPGDGAPFNDGANDGAFAFLQGTARIEQAIAGFIVGGDYALNIDFNARNCCTPGSLPLAEVYLNDVLLASSLALFPTPGGVVPGSLANGGNWWNASIPFTAGAETITLSIRTQSVPAGGDTTLIVDNVSIVPEPTTFGLLACGLLTALGRRRR